MAVSKNSVALEFSFTFLVKPRFYLRHQYRQLYYVCLLNWRTLLAGPCPIHSYFFLELCSYTGNFAEGSSQFLEVVTVIKSKGILHISSLLSPITVGILPKASFLGSRHFSLASWWILFVRVAATQLLNVWHLFYLRIRLVLTCYKPVPKRVFSCLKYHCNANHNPSNLMTCSQYVAFPVQSLPNLNPTCITYKFD